MLTILIFALVAVAAGFLFALGCHMSWWAALLLALAVFVLEHVVYVLIFFIASLFVDRSKPLEKQSKMCRAACSELLGIGCEYMGARIHVYGEEKLPGDQRFLLVQNHRSNVDPLVVAVGLKKYNISFISKPANIEAPVLGSIAYGAGYLPIDRENNRNALKTILTAADYIKRDICSMGIYPEGTRSKDSVLLPFHAGSFKIAQKAGCPLVITAIRGTEKLHRFVPFRITHIHLQILEVMPADKVKAMSTVELSEYSRNLISEALSKDVENA